VRVPVCFFYLEWCFFLLKPGIIMRQYYPHTVATYETLTNVTVPAHVPLVSDRIGTVAEQKRSVVDEECISAGCTKIGGIDAAGSIRGAWLSPSGQRCNADRTHRSNAARRSYDWLRENGKIGRRENEDEI